MESPSENISDRPLVQRFAKLCAAEGSLPDVFAFLREHAQADPADKAEICVIDLSRRWRSGMGFPVERYLEMLPEVCRDERLKLKLIAGEFRCLRQLGLEPQVDRLLSRFPELSETLRATFSDGLGPPNTGMNLRSTVVLNGAPQDEVVPSPVEVFHRPAAEERPPALPPAQDRIGRYRLTRILGDGGFGRVFLAYDEELHRSVAVKIPHQSRISGPEDVETYFTEARILASLDHPAIVPIYDFGRTDDGRCYAVSKYIEGSDLATKIKRAQLTFAASAELLAIVAEGLHYAHLRGIVHRDIKPANILIDAHDRPYIADFGIALQEEDFGKDRPTAGTPAYMSPEQVRGEGHLVDGRSDIFSLGVVLYELLTGRRLFGKTRVERTTPIEPRPPRQIDDSIPQELERICLKALSDRVAERYSTAHDMAADLRHFIDHGDRASGQKVAAPALSGTISRGTGDLQSATGPLTIVPKGLRSFDRDDAGFFLELLPGPRDRNGLPESVRFWTKQLTENDPERTFRVGLIYGPSGCGKSSFVKAGVLPHLPESIVAVYVESTPLDTEMRLLKALRKSCPSVPHDLDLSDTMTVLRRGRDLRGGTKVLIVLDQFEQWLHSRGKEERSELIRALRQCDGNRLQCVVSVRDDFWMAVTHFMERLEVTLVAGQNVAAVDLFRLPHARKILTALGRAYGALPFGHEELSDSQKSFVEKAVKDLAVNDQAIPVQLALFAEMVKDRPWIPSTLKEVGGTEGVGVTFLEETFNGRTANPHHRLHQKAAREVLQSLLSERSGSIKGGMRSYQELLAASGYEGQNRDFDALLRILDSELRLITPTDPEGMDPEAPGAPTASAPRERYYHLTHDYLVPSLHEWLARKQKETRRGRAELLLAERAQLWNARPANRSLPSLGEWLRILAFTNGRGSARRESERQLLRAASRYHTARLAIVAGVLAVVAWGAYDFDGRSLGRSLVDSLETAAIQDVPGIIQRMGPVRRWTDHLLIASAAVAAPESRQALHVRLALFPVDQQQQEFLFDRMLDARAGPDTLLVIHKCLRSSADLAALTDRLWTVLTNPDRDPARGFQAGIALVGLSPSNFEDDPRWQSAADFLAAQLVSQIADHPDRFKAWTEALMPARKSLCAPLKEIFLSAKRPESERDLAAAVLCKYAADRSELIVDLHPSATRRQHRTLMDYLRPRASEVKARFHAAFAAKSKAGAGYEEISRLAHWRADAAAVLFELGDAEPLWQSLGAASDPELEAFAEDRLAELATDAESLHHKLTANPPALLRASLLRTLGSMKPTELRASLREDCLKAFEAAFRHDPEMGVHSAAEWSLRAWDEGARLEKLSMELSGDTPPPDRKWRITKTGLTLAVFKGPIVSKSGSPEDEPGRDRSDEGLRERHIRRNFALATTEVTVKQFVEFEPNFRHKANPYTPTEDCPVVGMTWHRAAEFCLWLSQREGIPEDQWCYRRTPDSVEVFSYPDYLTRTGYRLPTEAEWEYACRAGSATAYSWGSDPSLGRRFAWSLENAESRHAPVGTLCPNRFGMFDMHGNVSEWTHERYRSEIPATEQEDIEEDVSDSLPGEDAFRVNRGGSAVELRQYLRAANRREARAYANLSFHTGFRVARTLP